MVTGDVVSLYTNMDLDRSVETVRQHFLSHPDPRRSDVHVLQLLEILLKNNDFEFDGQLYLQIFGTAMGKRFSPHLADLYLIPLDNAIRYGFRLQPLLYFRFLDDTFLVWPHSLDDLAEFQEFVNGVIPSIRVNFTARLISIDFLDLTVYKFSTLGPTVLKTKVFLNLLTHINFCTLLPFILPM